MIEKYNRKAVFDFLNKYCNNADKDDFIEVCEWKNGEGFDVHFTDRTHSFTWGEFEAITALAAKIISY